jgi:hypothetical protein
MTDEALEALREEFVEVDTDSDDLLASARTLALENAGE